MRDSFLNVALRYFTLTGIVGLLGFAAGAYLVGGMEMLFEMGGVILIFGLGSGVLGMWIPIGLFYEAHHLRVLYLLFFEACVVLMTLALGYAMAQAR